MSFCIISDHIYNYTKTKFHYNPQHIDQVKPKSEGRGGGGGASAPKAHPLDPPLYNYTILLKSVSFPNMKISYMTEIL